MLEARITEFGRLDNFEAPLGATTLDVKGRLVARKWAGTVRAPPVLLFGIVFRWQGEELLSTEDILDTIEKDGHGIAVILLPGIQYYTGQVLDMKTITKAGHDKVDYIGLYIYISRYLCALVSWLCSISNYWWWYLNVKCVGPYVSNTDIGILCTRDPERAH